MPHVAIKYFPRNLPETVKQDLTNDISDLLKKYLNAEDKSISVALTEVTPDRWKDTVYDIEIGPELDNLTKKTGLFDVTTTHAARCWCSQRDAVLTGCCAEIRVIPSRTRLMMSLVIPINASVVRHHGVYLFLALASACSVTYGFLW
ncbi:tautomerase PptA [Dickeya oryzae]